MTLFIETFTTILAIINPLEALPIILGLVTGKRAGASSHCSSLLSVCPITDVFFLILGTPILRLFGIPRSLRIVGGIILMRLGFALFSSSRSGSPVAAASSPVANDEGIAFVPLPMPIMFGAGAIATIFWDDVAREAVRIRSRGVCCDHDSDHGDNVYDIPDIAGGQVGAEPDRSTGDRCSHADRWLFCFRDGNGARLSWDD